MNELNPSRVRPAAVAGRFYPADPVELRRLLTEMLEDAPQAAAGERSPKALIVPHAGYLYSGPIAASAYARLMPDRARIRQIVLLGPAHYSNCEGLVACSAGAFTTPLGQVRVDLAAIERLVEAGCAGISDEAHAPEHSLEVQLPFLQVVLEQFTVVPLAVGNASPAEVNAVLEALWGGPETRIVVSSDLSHYLDSTQATRLDGLTAKAIERLDEDGIGEQQACGRTPICGLVRAARIRGMNAQTADLRNSSDTTGPRDRVVGYGAFLFRERA